MPAISSGYVEVCVFNFDDGETQFLLLQRSSTDALYPGIWQFVTGSIERDEKGVEAALRELREETGLSPRSFWIVPHVNTYFDIRHDSVNLSPVFAAEVPLGSAVVLSSEHTDSCWFSYDEAVKRLVWPDQRTALKIVQEYIVRNATTSRLTRVI